MGKKVGNEVMEGGVRNWRREACVGSCGYWIGLYGCVNNEKGISSYSFSLQLASLV